MQRRRGCKFDSRRGMTRVEVLTVVAACLLVAMIVVPGVAQSQAGARKVQCLNSMRNIGLAALHYMEVHEAKLPTLTTTLPVKNSSGQEGNLVVGWPIVLLPYLHQGELWKAINSKAEIEEGRVRIGDKEKVAIDAFGCPLDEDSFQKAGGLSYVVNAGFISRSLFQGDPDQKHVVGALAWKGEPGDASAVAVHAATGVMWRESPSFEQSMEKIGSGDGTSTTLLVTENLQAGNWYDTDTASIGFCLPVENTKGKVPVGDKTAFKSATQPLMTDFPGGTLATAEYQDWRINRNLDAKPSQLARPSSRHNGGVTAILCDGSGKFISQKIDPHVHAKLMTSDGVTYGENVLLNGQY